MCLFLLIVEEHVAKVLERLLLVRLTDEERDIVVAAAIRDHTYRYGLHSVKHQGLEAQVAPVEQPVRVARPAVVERPATSVPNNANLAGRDLRNDREQELAPAAKSSRKRQAREIGRAHV